MLLRKTQNTKESRAQIISFVLIASVNPPKTENFDNVAGQKTRYK